MTPIRQQNTRLTPPTHTNSHRRVFYWYVEAAAPVDPASAPLTLWTNGGPGCSGLFGLLEEMGPFRPTKDGKALEANPLSWNRLSNIVYIEVPVGVGFSYSHDPKDYRTGDQVRA
jgi:carboxypeptidase C (cathepsin A)